MIVLLFRYSTLTLMFEREKTFRDALSTKGFALKVVDAQCSGGAPCALPSSDLKNTPKAFANFSPEGLEQRSDNPGHANNKW